MRVSELVNDPLQLDVVVDVVGHHREVLIPRELPPEQIHHQVEQALEVVPGQDVTLHEHGV